MGKRPIKKSLSSQLRRDRGKANRSMMKNYTYIPTDYEKSLPSNLAEEKKDAYVSYSNAVTKEFCIEFARDLDEQVDNARGNGHLEGKENKKKRNAHEKRYLKNLGVPSVGLHCETTPAYIAKTDTIPQVQGAFIFEDHPQTAACVANNDKNYEMCCKNPEIGGGYVNIKEYVAEVQQKDPYCVIDTVVPSTGNVSGSGLHRVTIAPSIDENGNVPLDDETKLPKMTVYSFNHANKTALDEYSITHGVCFNLNDYARHNLKEEYQKNPEKIQVLIDDYNKENEAHDVKLTKADLKSISKTPTMRPMTEQDLVKIMYETSISR